MARFGRYEAAAKIGRELNSGAQRHWGAGWEANSGSALAWNRRSGQQQANSSGSEGTALAQYVCRGFRRHIKVFPIASWVTIKVASSPTPPSETAKPSRHMQPACLGVLPSPPVHFLRLPPRQSHDAVIARPKQFPLAFLLWFEGHRTGSLVVTGQ